MMGENHMAQLIKNSLPEKMLFTMDLYKWLELPCHVYLKDLSGSYISCNDIQAKSFGLSKGNEVIGRFDKEFFSRDDVQLIKSNDKEVLCSEKPKIVVEPVSFATTPAPQPFLSLKIPFRNLSGKLVGVFGTSISLINTNVQQTQHPNLIKQRKISKRERECLYYLAQGMTSKQIGQALNLSPRTIEFYIENIKRKFHCSNRIELIAKAMGMEDLNNL